MLSSKNSNRAIIKLNTSRETQPIKLFYALKPSDLLPNKVVEVTPISTNLNINSTKNINLNVNFKQKTHEIRSNLSLNKKIDKKINDNDCSMNKENLIKLKKSVDLKMNNNIVKNENIKCADKSVYIDPIKSTTNHQLRKTPRDDLDKMQTILKQNKNDFGNLNDNESSTTLSVSDKNDGNIIDDFLILNEKFLLIINNLKNSKNVSILCNEWLNYFYFCELKEKFDIFFKENERKFFNIKDGVIMNILSLNIILKLCFFENYYSLTKNLYNLAFQTHLTFLLVCQIMTLISNNGNSNKTHKLISEQLKTKLKGDDPKLLLENHNQKLFNSISNMIDLCDNQEIFGKIDDYLINLQTMKFSDVISDFKDNIDKKKVLISLKLTDDDTIKKPSIPFINFKPTKPYTLVLDLDETLINLNLKQGTLYGLISFRPGLIEFLEEVSKIYELIIFTCGTRNYANPIIDVIEKNKKYFNHKLFRDHTTINNNEFIKVLLHQLIKDLSLIGRDLKKTLIIDNIPTNFQLQKENGIHIKSFYSEDIKDTSLYEILPILQKIVSKNPIDITKELNKYRNELNNLTK